MSVPEQADPPPEEEPELTRWRGTATDPEADRSRAEDTSPEAVARLRRLSRILLGGLLRPHRRRLAVAVALLLAQNAAAMAGPYLVMIGIDREIGRAHV